MKLESRTRNARKRSSWSKPDPHVTALSKKRTAVLKSPAYAGYNGLEKLAMPAIPKEKLSLPQILLKAICKLHPRNLKQIAVDAFAELKRQLRSEEVCHDRDLLANRLVIRSQAAFAISEVIGPMIIGPIAGLAAQLISRSPFYGVVGTILGDYFGAIAGFAASFYAMNRQMYRASAENKFGRFLNFCKDGRPFLLGCAGIAVGLYAGDLMLGAAITHYFPNLSKLMPMILPISAFNLVVAEGLYLASTGIAFSGYIKGKLTEKALMRYSKYSYPQNELPLQQ